MLNKYGDFSREGKEFIITTPDIERNWYNYFFTDNYITFTSQAGIGEGFIQDRLGNRIKPVKTRGMYAITEDGGWNLCGLPVYDKRNEYLCRHGLGYTIIELEKNGIRTEYGLFVPDENIKTSGYEVAWVRVKNLSDKEKQIKIISYCENDFDGTYHYQGYNVSSLKFNSDINGMCYGIDSDCWNGEYLHFEGFMTCPDGADNFDCARNAFIGPYNSVFDPIVLHKGGCGGSDCIAEKACYALEKDFNLMPGEAGFVSFVMGITEDIKRIKKISSRFDTEEKISKELDLVSEKYSGIFGDLKIKTPDKELDKLVNYWLKYQTNMGSRWARVRHNGFRDMVSDTECLAVFNPSLSWERLKNIMTFQYSNGYAPRTVENGAIRDNSFADNTVWLTFAAYYIVNELGAAKKLLLEEVEYNDGRSSSVYEHLTRSVDWLYNFRGLHGLIKIWRGDWNDCMDRVGKEGKGVSVWLTMAWYRANRMLCKLAGIMGDEDRIRLCLERGEEMKELVDKYGYDEDAGYYIYAVNDEGRRICAPEEEEARIHLNPQTWAVLSGVAKDGKDITAMQKAEKLLSYELGTAVMAPSYTHYDPGVGAIGVKHPGVQENGGVYLHSMCWKLAVDAMLGYPDKVQWDLERILPFRNPVVKGRCEPYVLPNSYNGKETGYRYGTPGQSWRTASGQWLLKALVNFVFGINPKQEGIELTPCLPENWDEAEILKPFRDGEYHIIYKKTGIKKITVDGKEITGNFIPAQDGKTTVIFEY